MPKALIYIILLFTGSSTIGQHVTCLQNAAYEVRADDNLAIISRDKTILPVVIHVIYSNNIENISDEQVLSQLEVLNEDFSRNNSEFENTPDIFKNVSADTEIQFCLATHDPDGNPTSGITRTSTNIDDIGLTDFYFSSDMGGIDPWDNKRYINIWVASMGTSSLSGLGTFPGQAVPNEKDGILMNFKFFGREGLAEDFFPHHLGRICVHEMGHYLGLPHIFGSIGTGCDDDDGFNDTPLQDAPSFACPDFPAPDICTQNNGVMFMNFMDYTDDQCMSIFTEDQKTRMWSTLNGPREELLEQDQIACIVNTDPTPSSTIWNIYPNPAQNFFTIEDQNATAQSIHVINMQGQCVRKSKIGKNDVQIETSEIPAGIYLVKYKNTIKKLIILE